MLNSVRPKPTSSTPSIAETDLAARLKSLRNGTSSPNPNPQPQKAANKDSITSFPNPLHVDPDPLCEPFNTDDKTLDELLADLGPEERWTLTPDDPEDIRKLLDEAKSALPRDGETTADSKTFKPEDGRDRKESHLTKNYLTGDLDMSVFALDDGSRDGGAKEKRRGERGMDLEAESREAQDIVAKLLDEIDLDRANETKDEEGKLIPEENKDNENEQGGGLSLPSAPSSLPEPPEAETSKKSLDFESDIAARMAALSGLSTNSLGLPSAPTFKPIDKPVKGVVKKYTDEEVDSWCIICQDDATVKCIGCDGDLYCANCGKEGHMGPDVGWEEKRHKWVKFRRPN